MKIDDIKKQFDIKSEELFSKQFSLDAMLTSLLGREIETKSDESEASMLLMMKLVKDTVESALVGQKIYRLEQQVSSKPLLEHLSVLHTVDRQKLKRAMEAAPESIGIVMTGHFTEDGGFVGKFKYEDAFIASFIDPVVSLFSTEGEDEESIQFNRTLSQLVKETHVFSSSSEIAFYPPSVESMALYNEEGEIITKSFNGFKSFLATQMPSFDRDALLSKIQGTRLNLNHEISSEDKNSVDDTNQNTNENLDGNPDNHSDNEPSSDAKPRPPKPKKK